LDLQEENMNTLKLLVEKMLEREHLSVRAAGDRLGVSHTTIHRLLDGESLDLSSVIKICNALGVKPATALNAEATDEDTSVVSVIAAIIETEPRLATLFADLAHDFQEGTVSSDDVLDIVSYAGYRLENARKQRSSTVHAED
jgi:transcriptional regulator with XRE-family HTH domain